MAETTVIAASETYLYPFFPYYPEDQMILKGPDYRQIANDLAELCHTEDMISGFKWEDEGPHEVMYIYFLDGEAMRLTDMQAMLVLKGVLKGYKRLREKELGIQPQFEKLIELKKKPRSKETQFVHTGSLSHPATRKTKKQIQDDLAIKSVETGTGISIKSIQEQFLEQHEEDEDWMDDIFD